jgi:ATP-binding cassette subfamily B protein
MSDLRILSNLPGRVRWQTSAVRDRPAAAAALEADLGRHPQVESVRANPVTGTLLLVFSASSTTADATGWVAASLERLPAGESAVPARREIRIGRSLIGFGRPRDDASDDDEGAGSAAPSPLRRLLDDTAPYADLRRRAIAASVADGLANAVPPLLVGLAVSTVANPSRSLLARVGFGTVAGRLGALGVISAGYWVGASLLEYYRERTASQLADQVRRDLRVRLYDHVQRLDVATVEQRGTGQWMAVLDGDLEEVHRFVRHGGKPLMTIGSNLVVVGGTFLTVSPLLGLIQLFVIPPVLLTSQRMLKPLRQRVIASRDVNEQVSGMIAGNLSGIGTVASFGAEDAQAERVREAIDEQLAASSEANRVEAAYVPTLRAIIGGGFVTTVTLGAARVMNGTMSVAGLDTMAYGQLRLMSALARGGTGVEEFQRTSAALERIYATLDTRSSLEGGSERLPASTRAGTVHFDQVTFGYDPRTPVLRDIDLTIEAGSMVGIVGASGAGKSTLLKLLMRFYDPQHGTVHIDGRDVRDLQLPSLRQALSVVPQDITLFSGTIRENIALGRIDAPFADIVAAAEAARAHEFIAALPEGYETRLGFGGLTLSGGQRQRIAIARALVTDRPYLLFDEATSSLDHVTEAAIQRSLESLRRDRTLLIIAHRLSTVRHADVIHVMDEGNIVEQGTHDELVARGGIYASMWRIQTGEAGAA